MSTYLLTYFNLIPLLFRSVVNSLSVFGRSCGRPGVAVTIVRKLLVRRVRIKLTCRNSDSDESCDSEVSVTTG